MGVTPKKIDFDDIRKGDTIRIVDLREIKVTEAELGEEVRGWGGVAILREAHSPGTTRTFQLISREYQALPTVLGSNIRLNGGSKWVLIFESIRDYRGVWVNVANGTRQSPAFMQERANRENGFEVIA